MSIIIEKTYQFIDKLDNSQLITALKYNKKKLLSNTTALNLIKKYNIAETNEEKLDLKKKLYQIDEYKKYMQLYNELSIIIFRINKKYLEYTNTKSCRCKKYLSS